MISGTEMIDDAVIRNMPGTGEIILSEHKLEISVNDERKMHLTCTRMDLRELVYGHLVAEGIIKNADQLLALNLNTDQTVAIVSVSQTQGDVNPRDSGEDPFVPFDPDVVNDLMARFLQSGELHEKTFATHLASLVKNGEFLCIYEDISRHCAIDKAIGYGICSGIDMSECMLLTSGRVQEDTVRKLVNAGIPVIVSKAVASKQAIDLAKRHDMTLIGRANGNSHLVCYNSTVPTDL